MLSTLCPCEKSARNPRFIDLRLSIYPSFLLLVHILVHHTGTIQKLNLRYRVSRSDVRSWISFHEFNIPDAVACNADSHARYILSLFKSIIDLSLFGTGSWWCEETAGEERRAGEISSREIIRCVEVERKAKEKTGVWRVSGILSTTRTEESGGAALYS